MAPEPGALLHGSESPPRLTVARAVPGRGGMGLCHPRGSPRGAAPGPGRLHLEGLRRPSGAPDRASEERLPGLDGLPRRGGPERPRHRALLHVRIVHVRVGWHSQLARGSIHRPSRGPPGANKPSSTEQGNGENGETRRSWGARNGATAAATAHLGRGALAGVPT